MSSGQQRSGGRGGGSGGGGGGRGGGRGDRRPIGGGRGDRGGSGRRRYLFLFFCLGRNEARKNKTEKNTVQINKELPSMLSPLQPPPMGLQFP